MARGYHRRNVCRGNVNKAVTRARRAAASRQIGKAPGKVPGPAIYKTDLRRAEERILEIAGREA